jgi:hypothetical protein
MGVCAHSDVRLGALALALLVPALAASGCGRSGDAVQQPVGDTGPDVAPGGATPIAKPSPPRLVDLPGQEALSRIMELSKSKDVTGLAEILGHKDEFVAMRAAQELGEMGPAARAAIPALADLLGRPLSQDKGADSSAAEALAAIGRAAVPALVKLFKSARPEARVLAVQALGDMGPQAAQAVPALVALLEGSDKGLRSEAMASLGWIDPRKHDPDYPSGKLEPWLVLAAKKRLPAPDRLALEKETALGTIVVLDSRRRFSFRPWTGHHYLIGLLGPTGPQALVRGEPTDDLGEDPDAELTVHEIDKTPVAVELTMSCTDDAHSPLVLGVLLGFPSLKRLLGFTAIDSVKSAVAHTEVRKSKQAGKADALLVTTYDYNPDDGESYTEEKLIRRIALPTPVVPPPSTETTLPSSR